MTLKIKYPRTFHLPFSPGTTNDDKKLEDESDFIGKEVIITEKLDGENASITNDRYWARSVDSRDHQSRNWMQNLYNLLKHDLPDDLRICGESMYATHSIHYQNLESYFYCFSVWENEKCFSWDDTVEWCRILGLKMVPLLYRGIYSKEKVLELATSESVFGGIREGVVIRLPGEFTLSNTDDYTQCSEDFSHHYTKWVREGHVDKDSKHWFNKKIVPNELKYGE